MTILAYFLQLRHLNHLCFHLQSLLTDDQLANVPVLILGNKIDAPGAASEEEIRSYFGLASQTTGKVFFLFHS